MGIITWKQEHEIQGKFVGLIRRRKQCIATHEWSKTFLYSAFLHNFS